MFVVFLLVSFKTNKRGANSNNEHAHIRGNSWTLVRALGEGPGFFPNIFSITRRHTDNDVHASFASPVTSQSSCR